MNTSFEKLPDVMFNKAEQFSFAGVVALTRTAFKARRDVQDELGKQFTLRNKWTQRGIRAVPATKENKAARVFSADQYIADHEEGETRTPGAEGFFIPAYIRDAFGIDAKKRIPKGKRRSKILHKRIKSREPYIGTTRDGKEGVFHQDKNSGRTRMLYTIHKKPVKVKAKRWFRPTVQKSYTRNFKREYDRALKEGFNK